MGNFSKACGTLVVRMVLSGVLIIAPGFAHAAFSSTDSLLASAHESTNSFWCDTLSFITVPLGFCQDEDEQTASPPDQPPPPEQPDTPTSSEPVEATEPQPVTVSEPAATATPVSERIIRETPTYVTEHITNEYITNPTTVIREVVKETVRDDGGGGSGTDTSDFVSRSLFDAQVEATHNSFSDADDGITDSLAESVETNLLTVTGNGSFSGDLNVTSRLAVGTSTTQDTLTLDGAAYLASISPSQTTNRLYNQGGSLYWAGNVIAGGNTGTWSEDDGNVYRTTGGVLIGASDYSLFGSTATDLATTSKLFVTGGPVDGSTGVFDGGVTDSIPLLITSSSSITKFSVANRAPSDTNNTTKFGLNQLTTSQSRTLFEFQTTWEDNTDASRTSRTDFFTANNGNFESTMTLLDGKVGIGSSTPGYDLTVNNQLAVRSTSGAAALLLTGGGANTNFIANSTTTNLLSVAGGTGFTDGANYIVYGEDAPTGAGDILMRYGSQNKNLSTADVHFQYQSPGPAFTTIAKFTTSDVQLVPEGGGSVNIGTTSPSYKLTVAGDTWLDGALYDSVNNSAGTDGYILQTTGSGTQWVATSSLGISGGASTFIGLSDTPNSYTANRLPFTNSAGDALADSAELTFDGDRMLVVPNGGQSDGLVAANAFVGHHSAGSTFAVFAHKDSQNNTEYALRHSLAGQTNLNAADGSFGGIFFSINGTNQAVLDVNGNFGIGTTSPVSKLSVTGDVTIDGLTGSTGAGSLCLTSNNEVVFNSGSDACLPSLRETKHDIETLDVNALDMVSALESVSFEYNMGDGRTRYGFIAEDVADVDALLATYDAEGNISGIDDRSMIAVVVQAVQELWARVTGNTDRIEVLERELCHKDDSYSWCEDAEEEGTTTSQEDTAENEEQEEDDTTDNETSADAGGSDEESSKTSEETDTASSTDTSVASTTASSTDNTTASTSDEGTPDDAADDESQSESTSGETTESDQEDTTDTEAADEDSVANDGSENDTDSSGISEEAVNEEESTEGESESEESTEEESEPEAAKEGVDTAEEESGPESEPETETESATEEGTED